MNMQEEDSRWTAIRRNLSQSLYITAVTDWFMGLSGRLTELVLYFTVLYSCAQLYPGINLPEKLSFWVFIVQMGALDIGGLSLAKMARQAREAGNEEGAVQAEELSRWLIGIMLSSVTVVAIEHVVSIPGLLQTGIELLLVIARSICSVLYGRVVHALKGTVSEEAFKVKASRQLEEKVNDLSVSLVESQQQFQVQFQQFAESLARMQHSFQVSLDERVSGVEDTLSVLAVIPVLTEQANHFEAGIQRLSSELNQVKASVERQARSVVNEKPEEKTRSVSRQMKEPIKLPIGNFDRKQFVFACLSTEPEMSTSEIQRRADEKGQHISVGSISNYRTEFNKQQLNEENETGNRPAMNE